MSDEKNNKKKQKKVTASKVVKTLLILILILAIIGGGAATGIVLSIIKDAPEIDPSNINSTLDQTSFIYDLDGNMVEKIQAAELRTIVGLNTMPEYLKEAFISIEDERFKDHIGIDPRGIVSALIDNLKSGGMRGASTITQQLARGLYLDPLDKSLTRKITEMYLALQIERVLSKDQILESYLNRSYFGQNAYGVQEAAQTYFSKDVEDLTLAESALLAGVVKGTNTYQPFYRVKPEDFDSSKHYEVGQTDVLGEKYILVYNQKSVDRQKVVLKKMLDLGKISEEEYNLALNENIKENLKPGEKKTYDITNYFTDYVKTQVVEALVEKLGYTKQQAEDELYTGGLKIYSTINVNLQKKLEDAYSNFTEILVGKTDNIKGPILVDWSLNKAGNVLDDKKNIIFFKKDNLMTDDYHLFIEKGTYELTDGNLIIRNNKLTPYKKHVDVADFYTIDERKNLVTHTCGSIMPNEDEFEIIDNGVKFKKNFLDKNNDFYKIDENENLLIDNKFFFVDKNGIVQPQSGTVVMDYRNGHILAIVGGRDVDGTRILNRATASQRQPGSAIKPIAVYLPALDNGYTAASAIDDIPFYNGNGQLWPKNWYTGYRGMHTLRKSVEQSVNVNAVKTLQSIGIKTSMAYLEKMGIINAAHPEKDNIITSVENRATNDENLSALALGGMTKGLTPLEMTAAYGAIANQGTYIEPIAFTKIVDKNGKVLIDNIPKETVVTSPQVAYIMGDILRTTVSNGLGSRAKLKNMVVAGKTGTTQNQADIWFIGYTPYYVTGTWIGNDSPKITLGKSSSTAAQLWQYINTKIHEDLEGKNSFEKPDGIVSASICTQSGLLASELCTQDPRGVVKTEIFANGTVPTKYCDMHVALEIDATNGKIANEYCPESVVETRIFIQRTPPYNPQDHNGIVPSDYQYNAPTAVCDEHNESNWVPDIIDDWFNDWLNKDREGNGEDDNDSEEIVPLNPFETNDNGNRNSNGRSKNRGNNNGN